MRFPNLLTAKDLLAENQEIRKRDRLTGLSAYHANHGYRPIGLLTEFACYKPVTLSQIVLGYNTVGWTAQRVRAATVLALLGEGASAMCSGAAKDDAFYKYEDNLSELLTKYLEANHRMHWSRRSSRNGMVRSLAATP